MKKTTKKSVTTKKLSAVAEVTVIESTVKTPLLLRLKNGSVIGTFRFSEGGVEFLPRNGKLWTGKVSYSKLEALLKLAERI